jgi:HSP20 family protein
MTNKALINLLRPSYSPFFFDQSLQNFEDEFRGNFIRDYHENEEAYFTTIDMPGVTSSDINIDVEDSYIRVSAERKDVFNKNSTFTKKYDHVISIPKNVDKDNISAHYENGVLNLALHKTVEDKTKNKISVSTGEKPKSWSNFLNFKKNEAGKTPESEKTLN